MCMWEGGGGLLGKVGIRGKGDLGLGGGAQETAYLLFKKAQQAAQRHCIPEMSFSHSFHLHLGITHSPRLLLAQISDSTSKFT